MNIGSQVLTSEFHWRRWFFIVSLVVASLFFLYFFYLLSPVSADEVSQTFIIEPGEGLSMIVQRLSDQGLIQSRGAFKFYSLFTGRAHQLKPGTYSLQASFTTPEILNVLATGIPPDVSVVVVEGATLKEIDALLAERRILAAGELQRFAWSSLRGEYEFLVTARDLEGFLFPNTYRFFASSTPEMVVRKFLDTWKREAWPLFQEWEATHEGVSFYDRLIIASMVEKEVPFKEDRALVAGILDSRLAIGMALQIDASIVYAKCKGVFRDCPTLTKSDFQIISPYNTYTRRGLPPTPVGSPGLEAIQAAIHPQDSELLYYLSDPKTKKTIFSKTYEEHLIQKQKYLSS